MGCFFPPFHWNVDLQMITMEIAHTHHQIPSAAVPNQEWGHLQFPGIFRRKIVVQRYWVYDLHGNNRKTMEKTLILPPTTKKLTWHVLWFLEYFPKPRHVPSPGWSGAAPRLHPRLCSLPTNLSESVIWLLISWENMGKLHAGSPKPGESIPKTCDSIGWLEGNSG